MDHESEGRYESLLLCLGMALGSLTDPMVRAKLEDSLREERIHRGYIERLRDELTSALENSKV